ncbi:MAG TPA: alpha-E domain-containing protein [Rhizomicrobium sp.]|nr:alpha-E domain-containing protein [Rhizomicrobium sp.]
MLSRVADSLYWMNRYLERAEHIARLIAVKLETTVEQSREDAEAAWARVVAALSAEHHMTESADAMSVTHRLAFDWHNDSSMLASLGFARDNARQVRDQLTIEVWENLNRLFLKLRPLADDKSWLRNPPRLFRETLQALHALEGVTNSTLSHGEGWYFLELGRHIERAQLVCRLLDVHFGTARSAIAAEPTYFDWLVLLKSCSAFEPYCTVYTATIRPEKIAEFLLFDREFPHSVRYSVDRIGDALARVAPGAPPTRRAAVERLAGRLKATADFTQIDELMSGSIARFLAGIAAQCEQIHEAVYAAYITYGAETVL